MIFSLNIAIFTQLRLIASRWLSKQMQRWQPRSGACLFPSVDHLLPLTHRAPHATAVPSRQQNFWESNVAQMKRSRFTTLLVSIAAKLSLAFLFLFSSLAGNQAWAVACSTSISPYALDCDASGVTWSTGALTINAGVTVSNEFTVSNTSSTFVNNGSLITTNGNDGLHIGGVTTVTNNGTISGSFAGVQGFATTFINNRSISGVIGFYNTGATNSLTNNFSIIGTGEGVINSSTISNLLNTGTISGGSTGIYNEGTILTLVNTGTVTGGIANSSFFGPPPSSEC